MTTGLPSASVPAIVARTLCEARRAQVRKIARHCLHTGTVGSERLSCPQAESFPTEKPESFVSAIVRQGQRSPGLRSELVLNPRRSRLPGGVEKKVVGIKNLVAQIFVGFAVKKVRSALGTQVNHTTGELAPFGSQVTRLDSELLNRVLSGIRTGRLMYPMLSG